MGLEPKPNKSTTEGEDTSDIARGTTTDTVSTDSSSASTSTSTSKDKRIKKSKKKLYTADKDKFSNINKELQELKTRLDKAEHMLLEQETATGVFKGFKQKVELEESRARRNNIVVHGLPIINGSLKQSVNDFLGEKLQLSVQVKSAKCLGNPTKGTVPILISFMDIEHKLTVFRNCHLLRGERISITDDLTDEERERRKKLLPVLKTLKDEGKKVRFRGTDLYVNDVKYNGLQ